MAAVNQTANIAPCPASAGAGRRSDETGFNAQAFGRRSRGVKPCRGCALLVRPPGAPLDSARGRGSRPGGLSQMRAPSFRNVLAAALLASSLAVPADARRLESGDFLKLRSVAAVALSPDGSRIAYTVEHNDGPGRPYQQLWIASVVDGRAVRVGAEEDRSSDPQWSPDGRQIAFTGSVAGKKGLAVVNADGSGLRFIAGTVGTNSPLTFEGNPLAWSPDSKRIAFVSATPGPETELASGDPVVITRYKYKPDYSEGETRFGDNRRRHIFVVDAAGGAARALTPTSGPFEEHSIDWSPDGQEIAFVSNREPDPDLFYNADLFVLRVADGSVRRLTATEHAEFQPRWSPDGRRLAFMG